MKARYWNAVCLVMNERVVYERMDESIASAPFLLTSKPNGTVTPGFPLDSLSIDIRTGLYYNDPSAEKILQEENEEFKGFADFFSAAGAAEVKGEKQKG